MKHIIIIGDGMADRRIERLGCKTLLQYSDTPYMDLLAREGRTGKLYTIPNGFKPGSDVAILSILGYDLNKVYEGRGALEVAASGYEMQPDDMAVRCNLARFDNGIITSHNGDGIDTEDADSIIDFLNARLGDDRMYFIKGIQYRHTLIIKGGNKHIECAMPHEHIGDEWRKLLVKSEKGWENISDNGRMTGQQTADLLNEIMLKTHNLLKEYGRNNEKKGIKHPNANAMLMWGAGYKPNMNPLRDMFPLIKKGSVISAVNLVRGIGQYAGLKNIIVSGATGLYNTNYDGKVHAALEAIKRNDFVFLHIEASDEAGHSGDLKLKIRTIEDFDKKIIKPIYESIKECSEEVCISVMPDHYTPVELRTHTSEPVPFLIWHNNIKPDNVQSYDEKSCSAGYYGYLNSNCFLETLLKIR